MEQNRTTPDAGRDATHLEGLLGRLEEQGNSLYDVVGRVEALLARLDDDHSDEKTPDETSAAPTTGLLPQLCRTEDRIDELLGRVRAALDRLEGLV